MDRRQKKTRKLIFDAFIVLLSRKHYNQITVQEIIDMADIGRTTFYAHFETKDYLLKELCAELFEHIIDSTLEASMKNQKSNVKYSGTIFQHLFHHLRDNDKNILVLLSSQNNELFLQYFKFNLNKLIETEYAQKGFLKSSDLPQDYIINHISSSFVSTVSWWISGNMKESLEEITEYYLETVKPFIKI